MANDQAKVIAIPLYCVYCGTRHVDEGEWASRQHRRHLCIACGQEFVVEPPTCGAPADGKVERVAYILIDYRHKAVPVKRLGEDRPVVILYRTHAAALAGQSALVDEGDYRPEHLDHISRHRISSLIESGFAVRWSAL